MNFTHVYLDADQTTQQDVVDALIAFWESKGASVRARELLEVEDDEETLGYAVSSAQDGRIVVTDSELLDELEHGVAQHLADRLGSEVHVHGITDAGQGRTERLYRPEAAPVPRQVRHELWDYLYDPEEYVRPYGYMPWDPEEEPADPSWMRPYLDDLERMRRQLDEQQLEAPDLDDAWGANQYSDFAEEPGRAPSDAKYVVVEGVDPDEREAVAESFRGFQWVVGMGAVVDVREQFDNPLQVPVDDPEAMRERGFLAVEPVDSASQNVTIAVYIDQHETWGLVTVAAGTVWDAEY
ncbi:MAG: hypothetical protein ABEN55_22320, partial [Bradymonadaceae bacterium]